MFDRIPVTPWTRTIPDKIAATAGFATTTVCMDCVAEKTLGFTVVDYNPATLKVGVWGDSEIAFEAGKH